MHTGAYRMTTHPHPIFSFADMMIAIGSAIAMRIGYVVAVAPPDWNGIAGLVLAVGTAIGSLAAVGTALGGIYLKIRDYDGKIARLEAAAADALAQLAAAKRDADSKVSAAKSDADSKVSAIQTQNAGQQAELERLRDRVHDLSDNQQQIKYDLAAKPETMNVNVMNTRDNPIPVTGETP